MGRKLIGLSVGFLLTMALAYFLFPISYAGIIHWFAPYLGPWLRFFFMYLFIIFAHPLTFPTIIAIWVGIGLVTGLFIRTIGGTIGISIVIFGLTFLMLIFGLLAMIFPLVLEGSIGSLDFLAILSNIPPDVSLFDVIQAPVIGPIIESITGGLGGLFGGGTTDPSALLGLLQSTVINSIVIPPIANFVIFVIAGVIGAIIGRMILPPHRNL
ncbi:MAG: hypothetical protein ACFE89_10485 [Candidatus Hodarchaeota archaeon]